MDLSPYAAVLLDLDGTVYCQDRALPGAVELIHTLTRQAHSFGCLSNTTESPSWVSARLKSMGIDLEPARIYTATAAAVDYVTERFPGVPRVFNLATSGVNELLESRATLIQSAAEPCDAVIVGTLAGDHVNHDRMKIALNLLRKGALCVGICADRVYPGPHGLEFGSGSLSWMLSYAANVTPVFCGKPHAHFFEHACRRLGAAPQSCVLIGDNLEADVFGAKPLGIKTILTLTGVTTQADLQNLPPDRRPDWVIQTLRELL